MKLHRAGEQADWVILGANQRNVWQRLAVKTSGVATPGNLLTLIGLIGVAAGLILILRSSYGLGLILLAAGRLCDLLDGWLAERTGTKSPLGALFDATADKIETLAAVVVFVLIDLLPVWLALAVLLPHAITTSLSLTASLRGRPFQSSRAGKISMAVAWLGLTAVVLAKVLEGSGSSSILITAYGICAMATALGLWASKGYFRHR